MLTRHVSLGKQDNRLHMPWDNSIDVIGLTENIAVLHGRIEKVVALCLCDRLIVLLKIRVKIFSDPTPDPI